MEELEKKEEQTSAKINVKKSGKKGHGSGRQTKIVSKNSLKDTMPSSFGEAVVPQLPEFNANPKKAGEKRIKKLPKGQTTLNLVSENGDSKNSAEDMMEEGEEVVVPKSSSLPKMVSNLDEFGCDC